VELCCIAELHSADRSTIPGLPGLAKGQAGCKPAIQQNEILRYKAGANSKAILRIPR
jgi:hypothetical protein